MTSRAEIDTPVEAADVTRLPLFAQTDPAARKPRGWT